MNRLIDFSSRFRILKGGKISLVVSALLGSVTLSFAAPSGGTVISGTATINQSGNVININQSSQKASINWQNFSIARNETVNFNQPNVNSITLNRVIGNEKSVIDGALNANGQVWILNSNGVLFGKNASINTSGILATTAQLSDADFNAGNYNFKNSTSASIINQGAITVVNSGSVVLASNEVVNEGVIKAVKGNIHLVGADSYSLNLNGNSLVNLKVNKGVLDALVKNSGTVLADGGEIYLTTNAVNELLKGVVNNTGIIEANSLDGITGKVELFAHGGTAEVGGNINALDGFVETSGDKVKISDDFRVKADKWLIDPKDFTIAASGGDITGATLSSNLESADIEIQSVNGATDGNGDIFVNDAISWNAETGLTLNAQNNIYINDTITSTNGGLVLFYGQATQDGGTSDYYIKAKVNLKAGNSSFFTRKGSDQSNFKGWTVITHDNLATAITDGGLGHNYVLGSDLDLSSIANWTPIGNNTTKFTGNFDGLGHTVDNLTINRPTEDYIGLFGYTNGATIKNIGVTNVNIIGKNQVGGLVGFNIFSTVSNSYSTGSVRGGNSAYVGGLVGYNYSSTVSNSYSTASVTGGDLVYLGGLIGYNSASTISNSYATGSVEGGNNAVVGGLVGSNISSTVSNSYSTGSVTGGDVAYLGGLVGYSTSSTISNSYSSGSVTGGDGAYLGGLVNLNSGTITNSWYDNETNTATMEDSATYGKTKAQIVAALSPLEAWTAGGGASVEGYSTATALTLPELVAFYTATGEILFAGGFGTEANPYTITNWTQLQNINHSNILTQNYFFSLLNNLDASTSGYTTQVKDGATLANGGTGWKPIGNNSNKFTGTFDGLGHIVDNLAIYNTSLNGAGLFGWTERATIKNIGVTNANILAQSNVGGLVGYSAYSLISNTYTTGALYLLGSSSIGGLVGYHAGNDNNDAHINNSYSTASVESVSTGVSIGGLVGLKSGSSISNSYATGSVTAAGESNVGGLIGEDQDEGFATNSYYDKTVNSIGMSDEATYGKTTQELRTLAQTNWDNDIWAFVDATQEGFGVYERPILKDVTAEADKPDTFTLFEGGFGTSDDAYEITNWTQLQNINNSNILTQNYYFKLLNDLGTSTSDYTDLASSTANSGAGWNPIGYRTSLYDTTHRFIGNFDGLGHTIDGLYINKPTNNIANNNIGLFGYIYNSTLSNIGVTNANITGYSNVGALAGYIDNSTIQNSFSSGSVSSTYDYTGGLVGFTWYSTVVDSYSSANVTAQTQVGGLVGGNYGDSIVRDSYATGTVTATDTSGEGIAGGLVGDNSGDNDGSKIINSYATGDVSGNYGVGGLVGRIDYYSSVDNSYSSGDVSGTTYVGGLAGYAEYAIQFENSYATGDVIGTGDYVGGLVGYNYRYNIVRNSYATGDVSGESSAYVGGLVGYNYNALVTDSYSTGSVTVGNYAYAGGLVGYNYNSSTVSNSYSTGSVTVGNSAFAGGLVGYNYDSTVSNSYSTGSVTNGTDGDAGGLVGFNTSSSIVTDSYYDKTLVTGMSDENDYGKTTKEMQTLATFDDAGWDIEADSTIAKGNPFLAWQESENGYTKTWVIGTKVATSNTSGGSTTNGTTSDIANIITPIINNIIVPQPPKINFSPIAVAPQAQPVVMASTGQTVNLLSQPTLNQNTTMVTMGELRAEQNADTPNASGDIRVPVGDNSIIELVNGGVNLPNGLEQQFFVVANEEN